jgi:putative intracellular protease/amidase
MADSKKVAFLVSDEGIERVELTEPWKAVSDAGHQPHPDDLPAFNEALLKAIG